MMCHDLNLPLNLMGKRGDFTARTVIKNMVTAYIKVYASLLA